MQTKVSDKRFDTQSNVRTLDFSEVVQGAAVDKTAVALSFSRAANTYDAVAKIQQWVVDKLRDQIPFESEIESALDVGCGTGHLTQQLSLKHSPAMIYGLDIADGMLTVAREKAKDLSRQRFICGDAESLPFSNHRFDLIVSSFALQWCPDFSAVLDEFHRVLKPGGRCYFAIPASDTLGELKACWYQVDPHNTHVNSFHGREALLQLARSKTFDIAEFNSEKVTEFYPDLKAITGALKAMGAHNVTTGRAKQLTGKTKIKKLVDQYESYRTQQGLPVTWDVLFGYLKK